MIQKTKMSQAKVHQESLRLSPSATGIIPYMEQETEEYRSEVEAFRAGDREEAAFMSFRLHQGVY